jgi:serine/threonine protein phosphatase PrpC
MEYSAAQQSNQGGRDYNEDRTAIFARQESLLLIVADGLGGHAGGAVASQAFVDAMGASFTKATVEQLDDAKNFLSLSINYAHHMIHRRAMTQGFDPESPKTTCVVCLIHKGRAQWAHSGDSRLYLIRNGTIHQKTDDHVSVRDQASVNNPINRCVGGIESPRPSISNQYDVDVGDIIVLSSDGAWANFNPADLKDYIDSAHPTMGLDSLLQTLENRNKAPSDNLSMVILYWGVKQMDRPSGYHSRNPISVVDSAEKDSPPKAARVTDFNMKELDASIREIENFISELDSKL